MTYLEVAIAQIAMQRCLQQTEFWMGESAFRHLFFNISFINKKSSWQKTTVEYQIKFMWKKIKLFLNTEENKRKTFGFNSKKSQCMLIATKNIKNSNKT